MPRPFTFLRTGSIVRNFLKQSNKIWQAPSKQFFSDISETMDLKQVVSKLQQFAQPSLAGKWDNVGLLVEPSSPHVVTDILLTNDLTEPVLEEGLNKGSNLILSYHPPIFVPLKRLTQASWKERIVVRCLENRVAVYSPHTSYDAVSGGVNDWLVSMFDGKSEPIEVSTAACFPTAGAHRVDVSVPTDATAVLQKRLEETNGVSIHTLIGDEREGIAASRLTLNCTHKALVAVVSILHEFPEALATMEITDLQKPPIPEYGMGRKVKLNAPLTLGEAVTKVKDHLKLDHVRLATGEGHSSASTIKCVAACAGSGSSVLRGVPADLYLTGEMSHHEVLDAVAKGISVILCDHSNTERGFLSELQGKLIELLDNKVKVIVSEVDADPLKIV